jgi:hypothetical protein
LIRETLRGKLAVSLNGILNGGIMMSDFVWENPALSKKKKG